MKKRNAQLDGWRGLGILLILAGHLLPLGTNALQLAVPKFGMSFLLALSGYLVTSIAWRRPDEPGSFLAKRLLRVVPLAWLTIIIALTLENATTYQWIAHLGGFANEPLNDNQMALTPMTAHLWSFCAQSLSYIFIACLLAFGGKRALWLLPVAAVTITIFRITDGQWTSVRSEYRLDEVFAGSSLALLISFERVQKFFKNLNPYVILTLLFCSCFPNILFLSYFRPYLSATLIGWTLTCETDNLVSKHLENKLLATVAMYSYAIYCLHPLLAHTWLGSSEFFTYDSVYIKYAKRPFLFAALAGASYVSTRYFESWFLSMSFEKMKMYYHTFMLKLSLNILQSKLKIKDD